MRATKQGILIGKYELGALLEFTEKKDQRFAVVHFRVAAPGGKMVAGATDGKRYVECEADVEDGAEPGEWSVQIDALEDLRRLCEEGSIAAVLRVKRGGLTEAALVIADSLKVDKVHKWATNKASTQLSIEKVREAGAWAANTNGTWFAINAFYLADLQSVSKAADKCPITLYAPSAPDARVCFEATGTGGRWRGVIMPVKVQGPGDEAVSREDQKSDEDRPGQAPESDGPLLDRAKRPEVDEANPDADDGIIEDAEAERMKAAQQGEKAEPELATAKPRKQRKVKPSQMRPNKAKKGRGK